MWAVCGTGLQASTCMPRIAKQLSDRAVAAIKTEGRHPVGGVPGLHLRVTGEGHRGWVLRVQVGDKRCDYGLGAYRRCCINRCSSSGRLAA